MTENNKKTLEITVEGFVLESISLGYARAYGVGTEQSGCSKTRISNWEDPFIKQVNITSKEIKIIYYQHVH